MLINVILYFINFRNIENEIKAKYGLIIELYNYARENLKSIYPVTDDHVVATLMDPAQKNKKFLDKHLSKVN